MTGKKQFGEQNKSVSNLGDDVTKDNKRAYVKTIDPSSVDLRARQLVERSDLQDSSEFIPTGSNLIGKMVSTVDTRDSHSFIKVILPYGGGHRRKRKIPKSSIVLGKVKYSGKGRKFFIKFFKIIYPDGAEESFEAHALNSKDFSPGLIGDHHGNTGVRVATTLGLTAISAASSILTKKVAVGNAGAVAPAATMENAMYGSISKVSEMETKRQASELTNVSDYVTFDSGRELIVSLTRPFKGR